MKKLYRSDSNKIIYGILGGVGEYLEQDPAFIRFLFVFFMFITGLFPAALFYFVALFIVPPRPQRETGQHAHAHSAHTTEKEPRDI